MGRINNVLVFLMLLAVAASIGLMVKDSQANRMRMAIALSRGHIPRAAPPRRAEEPGPRTRSMAARELYEEAPRAHPRPKLATRVVPGDGNCFFHAVSLAVGEGQAAVRARMCDRMGLGAEHAMRANHAWADTIYGNIFGAIAEEYKRPVIVFVRAHGLLWTEMHSEGSFDLLDHTEIARWTSESNPIMISSDGSLHFNAVVARE